MSATSLSVRAAAAATVAAGILAAAHVAAQSQTLPDRAAFMATRCGHVPQNTVNGTACRAQAAYDYANLSIAKSDKEIGDARQRTKAAEERIADANKRIADANKRTTEARSRMDEANQQILTKIEGSCRGALDKGTEIGLFNEGQVKEILSRPKTSACSALGVMIEKLKS